MSLTGMTVREAAGQQLWTMSWQGACLALIVILLQRILGTRLAPAWRHALWWPVLLRLVLPVTPTSPWSLFHLAPAWIAGRSASSPPDHRLPPFAERNPTPRIAPSSIPPNAEPNGERQSIATTRSVVEAPAPTQVAASDAQPDRRPWLDAPTRTRQVVSGVSSRPAGSEWSAARALAARELWLGIWCLGFVAVLCPPLLGLLRLRTRLRHNATPVPPTALELWDQACRRLRIHRPIRLCSTPEVDAPALLGIFRPIVLVPPDFFRRFSPVELGHVFDHELAHVRRWDTAQNALLLLVQAVHWFNPLVWFALGRLRADREEAADALALSESPADQAPAYGLTLLKVIEHLNGLRERPGLVGILESANRLATRIQAIAQHQRNRRAGASTGILLLTALTAFGLADAPRPSPAKPESQSPDVPSNTLPPALLRRPPDWPEVTNGPGLRVRVVDASNGSPVPLAEVVAPFQAAIWHLEPQPTPRWITDEAGTAAIRLGAIPQRHSERNPWFTLAVRAPGFAPRGFSWSTTQGDARESVGSELEVRLRRGIRIGGIITDAQGRPMAGIRVSATGSGYRFDTAQQQEYPEFWRWPHESWADVTEADGRWALDDFPDDLKHVVVTCRRPEGMTHRFATDYRDEPFPPPPTLDLQSLREGRAQLVLPEGHTLRGRITDSLGQPLAAARIRAGFGREPHRFVDEVETDHDGRFALPHRNPIEWILSAEATGHAGTSLVVQVAANTPELRMRLPPAQPLRVRVTDSSGKGWPGVEIKPAEGLMEPHCWDFHGITDDNGQWVWNGAPLGPLALWVNPNDGYPSRILRLSPGVRSHELQIEPRHRTNILVRARTIDRDTGQPIQVATVAFRASIGAPFSTQDIVAATNLGPGWVGLTIPSDWFQPGTLRGFQLRFFAPAYGSEITEAHYFDEGDWEPTIRFRRGGAIQGRVRQPDGAPAEDAELTSSDIPHQYFRLGYNRRFESYQGDMSVTRVRTDAHGRFGANHPGPASTFLVTHASGFREIPAPELAALSEITLQPWARLEGVLRSGGVVLPGATVVIRRDSYGRANQNWGSFLGTTTDAQGRFVFTNLPAGDFVLHRFVGSEVGSPAESHHHRIRLEAGQTVQVDFGGNGSAIVGQLPKPSIRWADFGHQLVARVTNALPSRPSPDHFATSEHWLANLGPYYEEMNGYWNARRTYVVIVREDGSFRAEDVPAGVYDLEIQLQQDSPRPPGSRGARIPYLGSTTQIDDSARLTLPVIIGPPERKDGTDTINLGRVDFGMLTQPLRSAP